MSKKWVHIRPQRGGLNASMMEHKTILAIQSEVDKFFADGRFQSGFKVEPYSDKPDNRIDWPCTWIVMHPQGWPVGFVSGAVENDDPSV